MPLTKAKKFGPEDRILTQDLGYYATGYDKQASMSRWSMVVFTPNQFDQTIYRRRQKYSDEPTYPDRQKYFYQLNHRKSWSYVINQLIYRNPKLVNNHGGVMVDRGHMTAMADVAGIFDGAAQELLHNGTYFLDNIAPQLPEFNSGPWLVFEEVIREMSKKMDTLWVISGPAFSDLESKFTTPFIPGKFFKVLLGVKSNSLYLGSLCIHHSVTMRAPSEKWNATQCQVSELPRPVRKSATPLSPVSLGFQPFPDLTEKIDEYGPIKDIWEAFPWDEAVKKRWSNIIERQSKRTKPTRSHSAPPVMIQSSNHMYPRVNSNPSPNPNHQSHIWHKAPRRSVTSDPRF